LISISRIMIDYGFCLRYLPFMSIQTNEVHLFIFLLLKSSDLSEILVILEIHHIDVVPWSIYYH
jgi:hypothetical protein